MALRYEYDVVTKGAFRISKMTGPTYNREIATSILADELNDGNDVKLIRRQVGEWEDALEAERS